MNAESFIDDVGADVLPGETSGVAAADEATGTRDSGFYVLAVKTDVMPGVKFHEIKLKRDVVKLIASVGADNVLASYKGARQLNIRPQTTYSID